MMRRYLRSESVITCGSLLANHACKSFKKLHRGSCHSPALPENKILIMFRIEKNFMTSRQLIYPDFPTLT